MHLHALKAPTFLHLSEAQCSEMLFRIRWPEGYRCPRCRSSGYSVIRTRRLPLYECVDCRKQCSVISGTVMERSRTPLSKWFTAAALIAYGCVSAAYLARRIGVTYKTAWLMLHKLRDAMAGALEGELLTGLVRLHTGIANRHLIPSFGGLHPTEHPYIIGASVNEAGEPERIRIALDSGGDTYKGKITPEGALHFIGQYVDASGTVELTVDSPGRLDALAVKKIGWSIECDIRMFHGTVGAKHLHYYLQEGVYRYIGKRTGGDAVAKLMRLFGSSGAPDRRAIVGRPEPPRPDWISYRNMHRMNRRMRELAAELSTAKSSA
jgi:transposase-like protein